MSLLIFRIVIIKFKVQISKFKVMMMFKTIDFRALTAILLFLLALLFSLLWRTPFFLRSLPISGEPDSDISTTWSTKLP